MKNYAVTKEEKQKFIKKYTIYEMVGEREENEPDKKIYITLGNNKNYIIPYTEENENLVKAKMKRQIREYIKAYKTIEEQMGMFFYELKDIESELPFIPFSDEYLAKIYKQEVLINRILKIFIGSSIALGIGTLLFTKTFVNILLNYNITLSYFSVPLNIGALLTAHVLIKDIKTKNDLIKNNYFLENEEIYKCDYPVENIALNLNKKATKYLDTLDTPISINDLDKFTLSDLRHLKENIERYQYFKFNEEVKHNQYILKKN